MTLDEIKAFCFDHDESTHAKVQYTSMIKYGKDFHISFLGKDRVEYVQLFDKNGIPVGDIIAVDYDEYIIELDEVLWDDI